MNKAKNLHTTKSKKHTATIVGVPSTQMQGRSPSQNNKVCVKVDQDVNGLHFMTVCNPNYCSIEITENSIAINVNDSCVFHLRTEFGIKVNDRQIYKQ